MRRQGPSPLLLPLLVAAVCLAASVVCQGIKEAKVHYVDSFQGRNFLLRGDQPRNDSVPFSQCGVDPSTTPLWMCFGWEELRNFSAAQVWREAGLVMPQHFSLLDISLIGGPDAPPEELLDLRIERAFFEHFPERGRLVHWPTLGQKGSQYCPVQDQSPGDIKRLASGSMSWMSDDLVAMVPQIREWLHTPSDPPLVIYLHCEHGMDRTGEVAGAYEMQYLHQSYQQVVDYNDHVGVRPQMPENKCAMHWYCYFLQLHSLPSLDCTGDGTAGGWWF